MKATQTYGEATGRSIGPKTLDFIHEIVEFAGGGEVGDERVAAAIWEEVPAGKFGLLLGRVRDRIAKQNGERRRRPGPLEIDSVTLMRIVRGEIDEPTGPYAYDAGRLDQAEYTELLTWSVNRDRRRLGLDPLPNLVEVAP